MPQLKPVPMLEELCHLYYVKALRNIKTSLDVHPLSLKLSAVIMEQIIDKLCRMDALNCFNIKLLLCPDIIKLNFYKSHYMNFTSEILNIIGQTCYTLKILNLQGRTDVKTEELEKLLNSLCNLTYLNICGTSAEDSTIDIIFEKYKKIIDLDISSLGISNKCVQRLRDTPEMCCPTLIQINILCTGITIEGVKTLLLALPHLQILHADNVMGAIEEIENEKVKPYVCLTYLYYDKNVSQQNIASSYKMCPWVKNIQLDYSFQQPHTPFLPKFLYLEEFHLYCFQEMYFDNRIVQLLELCGENIKVLDINGDCQRINVFYIAKYCPYLTTLNLVSRNFNLDDIEDLPIPPFLYVKKMCLKCIGYNIPQSDVAVKFLLQSCHNLNYLHIVNFSNVDDNLLDEIYTMNSFHDLDTLILEMMPNIECEFLNRIMLDECNKLKKLFILCCYKINKLIFQTFENEIKQNNLDIVIEDSLKFV